MEDIMDMGEVDRAHQKLRLGVTYILSFAREMESLGGRELK